MRRLLVGAALAVAIFVALAMWNGFVAVLFGIAVLAYVLATLYRRAQGGDMFDDSSRRR